MIAMGEILETVSMVRRYAIAEGLQEAVDFLQYKKDDSVILEKIYEDICQNLGNKKIFKEISEKENVIYGNFSCAYHPYLSVEYSEIISVQPSLHLDSTFKHIRCVVQKEGTEGISNPQVVAIFPENFRGREAQEKDPVYYFVNKFSQRHFQHTRPFLNNSRFKKFFQEVLMTDSAKTYELIANWVHIHEQSHRKGPMPIPTYLKEKSGKYSAAMEELRADLGVIQYCLQNGSKEAELTALYVFAERLMAYPLFRERTNFDAISSVFFWKYLQEKNFFLGLSLELLKKEVNELISMIHSAEMESLKFQSVIERRTYLNDFVRNYLGDIDSQFENYRRFWEFV